MNAEIELSGKNSAAAGVAFARVAERVVEK
jgi:hypothetical protein